MKKILLPILFILTILFSSCSKYGFVRLNYPTSPQVILPDNIQSIAVVNRSLTKADFTKKKTNEAILTGEIAGSDRITSDDCLKGILDRSLNWRGMRIVIPPKTRLYGTGTRETPELLDWKLVKAICDSNQTDALLVLENFDSNTDIIASTVTPQVTNIINGQPPRPTVPSRIKMNVLTYWRLYDPKQKTIIDQFQNTNYMSFDGVGLNYLLAPPEALHNTAFAAGQMYIERFLPSYYTVRRDMYKRGKGSTKQAFKAAFRKAEVANWESAMEQWKTISQNGNRKSAGRACLDVAVAYEVLGKTDEALKWAKKAYEDYNDKLARDYAKILLERQRIE